MSLYQDLVSKHLNYKTTIRLNTTHYFIMKIPDKRELQQIASNHSSENEFKDLMRLYEDDTEERYHQIINKDLGRNYYKMTVSEKIKQLTTISSKTKFSII